MRSIPRHAPSAARASTPTRSPARPISRRMLELAATRRRHRLHGADRRGVGYRQGSAGAFHSPALRRAPRRRSSRSTARRSPRTCSRRCCSATSAAPSPARTPRTPASSSRRRAARCCSTRSPRCRWRCRPSCCACCRSARSSASAAAVPMALDVRVLATTNRRLREEVAAGRFREDLYYRLNVFPAGDRAAARSGATTCCRWRCSSSAARCRPGAPIPALSAEAAHLLLTYPWPGNVRELDNLLQRALILVNGPVIRPEHMQFELARRARARRVSTPPDGNPRASLAASLGDARARPDSRCAARRQRQPARGCRDASASARAPCATSSPACATPASTCRPRKGQERYP